MNKMYQKITLFLVALHLFTSGIVAQTNISPLATITASSCNTGPCSTINDLNYGTCGTQQVWIPTSTPPSSTPGVDWIEWEWTTTESFGEMTIHHAQSNARFLTGALIQLWNGTAWVNHHTFSNLPMQCINTITFPIATTNRMRITAFQMTGTGQLSNPNFREIEIFGQLGCTGAPDPGVASANATNVPCNAPVDLTLTGADTGAAIEYQWQYNSGSGWINFGTNDTFATFASMSVNTQFRCEVICVTSQGGSDYSNTISATVIPAIPLTITPANPEICQGESVTLTVPASFSNLRWEPPTGLDTLEGNVVIASPYLSHTYTVTGEDSNGCGSSANVYVQVNPLPIVVFDPGTDVLCLGDSIEMVLRGGSNYAWLPTTGITQEDDSTFILKPTNTTNYAIEVINANGCTNEAEKTINVNPLPMPVISFNGERLLTAPTGYVKYMWYVDGLPIVPIAWQHLYNIKKPGTYHVVVTDSNGCEGSSNVIDTKTVGIDNIFADGISIYPNPTKGILNVESSVPVAIEVKSIDGRSLFYVNNASSIDISQLSDGMYFLVIREVNGNGVVTHKITKTNR